MPTKNTTKTLRPDSAKVSITGIVSAIADLAKSRFSVQVHLRGNQDRVVSAITRLAQSGKMLINTVSVGLRLRGKDVSSQINLRGDYGPVVSAVTRLTRTEKLIKPAKVSASMSLRGHHPVGS